MTSSRIVIVAAVAALAAACTSQPATTPRPDAAAIHGVLGLRLSNFATAIETRNVEAVANMFTEDGTWILPDASAYTGRVTIKVAAKNYFDAVDSFVTDQLIIDKLLVVSDSEAVTFSHGNYTLTEKGKPPTKRLNPVADYWKKGRDGVWRVAYELNADGPAVTAAVIGR